MLSLKRHRNFPRLPRGFPVSPLPHSLLRWKACEKSRKTQVALKYIIFLLLLTQLEHNKAQSSMKMDEIKILGGLLIKYLVKKAESYRGTKGNLFLINTRGNRNAHQPIQTHLRVITNSSSLCQQRFRQQPDTNHKYLR